jgi:hypothetical protein
VRGGGGGCSSSSSSSSSPGRRPPPSPPAPQGLSLRAAPRRSRPGHAAARACAQAGRYPGPRGVAATERLGAAPERGLSGAAEGSGRTRRRSSCPRGRIGPSAAAGRSRAEGERARAHGRPRPAQVGGVAASRDSPGRPGPPPALIGLTVRSRRRIVPTLPSDSPAPRPRLHGGCRSRRGRPLPPPGGRRDPIGRRRSARRKTRGGFLGAFVPAGLSRALVFFFFRGKDRPLAFLLHSRALSERGDARLGKAIVARLER